MSQNYTACLDRVKRRQEHELTPRGVIAPRRRVRRRLIPPPAPRRRRLGRGGASPRRKRRGHRRADQDDSFERNHVSLLAVSPHGIKPVLPLPNERTVVWPNSVTPRTRSTGLSSRPSLVSNVTSGSA